MDLTKQIDTIRSKLTGPLVRKIDVTPRQWLFIREGPVRHLGGSDQQKMRDAYFYLFNDFFLFCTVKAKEMHKVKIIANLDAMVVHDIKDSIKVTTIVNAFELFLPEGKKLYVSVSTNEEKGAWAEQFRKLLGDRYISQSDSQGQHRQLKSKSDLCKTPSTDKTSVAAKSHSETQLVTREALMVPWEQHFTHDREIFYHNPKTGETSWELPVEIKLLLDENGFLAAPILQQERFLVTQPIHRRRIKSTTMAQLPIHYTTDSCKLCYGVLCCKCRYPFKVKTKL